MGLYLTLFGAAITLIGVTTQNVTLVYWTLVNISQYGILIVNLIISPTIFFAAIAIQACRSRDPSLMLIADSPAQRSLFKRGSLMQLGVIIGIVNILAGFGIVYASQPDRTPPLIQAILQNSGIVISIPFSKWILGDQKTYLSFLPLLACACIVLAVAISIIPTLQAMSGDAISASTVPWIFVYLAGLVPNTVTNVLQQRFLILSGALEENATPDHVWRTTLRMTFYSNALQGVALVAMFWMDFLPWFGASSSMSDFWTNTVFSIVCSFTGTSGSATLPEGMDSTCPWKTPFWAFGFALAYVTSFFGSALLNRESATFNMLVFVVTTMVVSAFWLIPGTNPAPANTPLWSVLPSLALTLVGSIVWKIWENRMPVQEQFTLQIEYTKLHASDDWQGGGTGYKSTYSRAAVYDDPETNWNDKNTIGKPLLQQVQIN